MRDLYWRAEAVIGGAAPAEVAHVAAGEAFYQLSETLKTEKGWREDQIEAYVDNSIQVLLD